MHPFNKKKDKLMIQLVKNYPVLYDSASPNFKNCIVKHKVWECISATMKIPIPDLKKRWKHFRDHFQKKFKAETAGLSTFHTWEYRSHLSFLEEFCQKDKPKDESDQEELGNEVYLPDSGIPVHSELGEPDALVVDEVNPEINEDALPKKKRKKLDTLAALLDSRLAERFRYESAKPDKSPIHKFFESMADIVSEFPPYLVAETRLKVCQIVNEIEMKKNIEEPFM